MLPCARRSTFTSVPCKSASFCSRRATWADSASTISVSDTLSVGRGASDAIARASEQDVQCATRVRLRCASAGEEKQERESCEGREAVTPQESLGAVST